VPENREVLAAPLERPGKDAVMGQPPLAAQPVLRGIVFDLDGTLVTQELDFEAMRRELTLPSGTPLLEALEQMAPADRAAAEQVLWRHEQIGAATAVLNPGVPEFLDFLAGRALRVGLLSRNCRAAVDHVVGRLGLRFDAVVAREDAPFKPSPHGLWQICAAWRLAPAEVLMVGDYLYDVQAGRNAGCRTALVTHGRDWPFADLADLTFPSFVAVPDVLRSWLAGQG
jgi:HAD superfamily hydrolase (TIGR01549 family)